MTKGIILIGHKSAGKSTVGQLLAQQLQVPFFDTDTLLLEKSQAESLADLFQQQGEKNFRQLEHEAIMALSLTPQVIATGGGALLKEENVEQLKKLGALVYLKNSFEHLQTRNQNRAQHGILAATKDAKQNYQQRHELYAQQAEICIDCDNKNPEALCTEILAALQSTLRK